MLVPKKNMKLYADWAEYIENDEAKSAYHVLIGAAAASINFSCYPTWKGEIRDFRFYDQKKEQPFSFIVNRNWLLFYLRPPAVRLAKFVKSDLVNVFGEVNENKAGEWTVRIRNRKDALQIIRRVLNAWKQ